LIFFNQRWGESNAVLSLVGLDVVSMYMIREEGKISFFRVYKSDISSWNISDGLQIAIYYSRVFGMFGQKSHSHFSYASSLESYPMKPNMGLVRIYRLMHVVGRLRTSLGGSDYEEEK
jgi:hypothetical protein